MPLVCSHRTLAWLGAMSSSVVLVASLMAAPALADTEVDQSQSGGAPQTLIGVVNAPAVPPEQLPPASQLPPPPPSYAAPVGPFTMYMEVLASASPSQFGLLASPGCVTDSVYKRGMKLVFRFALYDMDNDVQVTSADGSTAQVMIPNGPTLDAVFLPRGGPTGAPGAPWTWVTTWQIPPNYPLGEVDYTVQVATPDGRSAQLTPISFASTYPTIVP